MSRDEKSANDRATLCPLCKHRHYAREPHNGKKTAPAPKAKRGR